MGFTTNLLEQTLEILYEKNKKVSDVKWVGSKDFYTSWEHFSKVANVSYDDGFGAAEIAEDLVVVGDDWWLERYEYDGSEAWVFKSLPQKPLNKNDFERVNGGCWNTLKELNNTIKEQFQKKINSRLT